MANPSRGEVQVTLAGEICVLRPTFHALCELEHQAGCGIIELARKFHAGNFSLRDAACIIWAGLRGAGKDAPALDAVGERVLATGVVTLLPALTQFLFYALGGSAEE